MARPRDPALTPLLAVFFLSGVSALSYEVLWTRDLGLIFGITSYAVGTVLAAYMAGLALGSAVAGRVADRLRRPLLTYGRIELAIGVAGLSVPPVLGMVRHIVAMSGAGHQAGFAPAAFALLASGAVLLIPTALMGATLPLIARHACRGEHVGARVGLLYAMNTLGGMAGAFLTAFVLIEALGVRGTNLVAVGLNIAVGGMAVALSLRPSGARDRPDPGEPRRAVPVVPAAGQGRPATAAPRTLIVLAYGASGAAALAYEILITRVLIFFLWDTTVYSFATMLTVFLAGLALGSAVFARIADRVRPLVALFGLLQAGVGLATLAMFPAFGHLAHLRTVLWTGFHGSAELGLWRYLGLKFVMAFVVLIVPTFLMGGAFPVVSRIVARDAARLGRAIGAIYSANTLGAILGSVVGGFWLAPVLGTGRAIAAVSALNLLVGLGLIGREPAWPRPRRIGVVAAVIALAAAGAGAARPGRPMVRYADLLSNPEFRRELLFTREGREATLSVLRDPASGVLELNINGQSTAFTSYMDLQVHRMLGHLPVMCHPGPRSALVIGFGFGSTCHALVSEGLERVDCVELIPDERMSAAWFADVNQNVLARPAFRFIPGDGRQYVLAARERYDLISFNAIHPKLSASLYTEDFYRLCAARLAPGGVIAAWLPVNFLSRDEFHLLVRTFQHVFPHATMWYVGPGHVILIGTPERYRLDLGRIAECLSRGEARADLDASNLGDPVEIAAMFILDEDALRRFAGSGPLNTDDHPRVEYGISFSSEDWYRLLQEMYALTPKEPPADCRASDRDRLARMTNARSYALFGSIVHAVGVSTNDLRMVALGVAKYRRAVEIAPESRNLRRLLEDKEEVYDRLAAAARGGREDGSAGGDANTSGVPAPPAGRR